MIMKKIVPIIFLLCSAVSQLQAVVVTLDVFANEHGAVVINLGDMHVHFPATMIEEFEGIVDSVKGVQDLEFLIETGDYSDYKNELLIRALTTLKSICMRHTEEDRLVEAGSFSVMDLSMHHQDAYNKKVGTKDLKDWFVIPKIPVDPRLHVEIVLCFIDMKLKFNQENGELSSQSQFWELRGRINTWLEQDFNEKDEVQVLIQKLEQKVLSLLSLEYLGNVIMHIENNIESDHGNNLTQSAKNALSNLSKISKRNMQKCALYLKDFIQETHESSIAEALASYPDVAKALCLLLFELVQVKSFLHLMKKQKASNRSVVFLGAGHIRELNDFYYDIPEFAIFGVSGSVKSIEELALECNNYYAPGLNDLLFLNGYTKLASYNLLASAFDDQTKEFTLEGCRKVIAQLKEKLSYWVNLPTEEIIQLVKADQEKEMLAQARAREQRKVYKKYRQQRYQSPEFMKKKRLDDLEKDTQLKKNH